MRVLLWNMDRKTIPTMYIVQLVGVTGTLTLLFLLGITSRWALNMAVPEHLLIGATLLITAAGLFNIALFYIPVENPLPPRDVHGFVVPNKPLYRGVALIAVNVGGAILPLCFAISLLFYLNIDVFELLLVIMITTAASFLFSRPIHGFGLAIPVLIVPVITAISSKLLVTDHLMASAYIAGTIGVILGTDILRIKDLKQVGASFISIGGAGIFDGIVLIGILSSLLILIL